MVLQARSGHCWLIAVPRTTISRLLATPPQLALGPKLPGMAERCRSVHVCRLSSHHFCLGILSEFCNQPLRWHSLFVCAVLSPQAGRSSNMNVTAKSHGAGAGTGVGAGGGGGRQNAAATMSTAHVVVTPGDIITAEAGYLRWVTLSDFWRPSNGKRLYLHCELAWCHPAAATGRM